MRARALARRPAVPEPTAGRPLSPAGLLFLRGRDADGRLRELAAARLAARPVLGALSVALLDGRVCETLGYRSLGDYGRERLGVGARAVREWARVWRRLGELPVLRHALASGEIGWSVARRVVGLATPETEEACLATVRGRTLRAVEAILAAVREAHADVPAAPADEAEADPERVGVRLPCTPREALLWRAALELARRMAGQELPVWQCAESVAAEAASAIGAATPGEAGQGAGEAGAEVEKGISEEQRSRARSRSRSHPAPDPREQGLCDRAFPGLRWTHPPGRIPPALAALPEGLEEAPPREIDRRLRAAIAFLQTLDLETGRILRQIAERRLFLELGFPDLARYVEERLDLSPRTARRLIALARTAHRAPEVATAFRQGRIHAFQAQVLSRVADLASARAWVERARSVTFRRLEEDAEGAPPEPSAIAFPAPPEVAELFLTMLARAGSLERLLAHAIRSWLEQGELFEDYADFERDGFRCTAPGCTGRNNLHSHHIRFRSHQGPDEPWNRTTLCAYHHERALHLERTLRIRGRAPDRLVFALGPEPAERFRSGDLRIP
jgi:hypothetical protein